MSFKIGEYVVIKNVLFKVKNIKIGKKEILLKGCNKDEIEKVKMMIEKQKLKEG